MVAVCNGSAAWGTQDTWNLISCSSSQSSDDPFSITPPSPFGSFLPAGHPALVGTVSATLSLAGNDGGMGYVTYLTVPWKCVLMGRCPPMLLMLSDRP